MTEWFSVRDKLPNTGTEVLATFKGQFRWVTFVATMNHHHGLQAAGYAAATHWSHLPCPPSSEEAR